MYSLDVNFLKDRPDLTRESGGKSGEKKPKISIGEMTPLFIGLAIGLLLPGAVGGLWFLLSQQIADLEQQQNSKKGELAKLEGKLQEVKSIEEEIKTIKTQTDGLVTVFNQIKPWSAMLQDLRDRIPPNVQVLKVEQKDSVDNPTGGTSQSPLPPIYTTKISIDGSAASFNDVNDFMLTLQRSPFVKKEETQILKAELKKVPLQLPSELQKTLTDSGKKLELPDQVLFKIETTLNNIDASELIRELDRKGAVGLATRIRNIQKKGGN